MLHIILGLGNPGADYEGTRHSTGRMFLEHVRKELDFPEWEPDKKLKALVSEGKAGKHTLMLMMPETFMNKSGSSLSLMKSALPKPERVAVVYDDLDLPLGRMKLAFDRGSGGHRGLESVIRALKTKAFLRVRIGISPKKKPHGDKNVQNFILGKFKSDEVKALRPVFKKALGAISVWVAEGKEQAINVSN